MVHIKKNLKKRICVHQQNNKLLDFQEPILPAWGTHTSSPSGETPNASGHPPQGLLPGPETLLFNSILGPS